MSKLIFKLNGRAVAELMKSKEMESILDASATRIKEKCGEGYEKTEIYVGQNRSNVKVRAHTYQAKSDNNKNNTLLKALRAGKI